MPDSLRAYDEHGRCRAVAFLPPDEIDPPPPWKIAMTVSGPRGVVEFTFATGWTVARAHGVGLPPPVEKPSALDLGYHAPVPQYDGHPLLGDACALLDGLPCYYEANAGEADALLARFIEHGPDAVWGELCRVYDGLRDPGECADGTAT